MDDRAYLRPLVIENRIPCGVPIAALDDHMVIEDALEAKTKAPRGISGFVVKRIAAPLHAPVAKLFERRKIVEQVLAEAEDVEARRDARARPESPPR